jgi:hypothetical protein
MLSFGAGAHTFEQSVNANAGMSMASSRVLMRVLAAAFLLLLGNATDGRSRISVDSHRDSHRTIAAANHSALLAATPVGKDVDSAFPPLLASDARLHDRRVEPAPAPARDSSPPCSYERTAVQAARPPPFQA